MTLLKRGLDFARSNEIFTGDEFTIRDDRNDYGEARFNTFGFLDGRLIVITWTLRRDKRRIVSMRKTNEREQTRFGRELGRS